MKNRLLKTIITPILALGALGFAAVSFKAPEKVEEASAWSGTQTCSAQASYYSGCDNLYGTELSTKLASFNKPTSPNYDWSRYKAADEAENDSNSILSIYTRHTIAKNSTISGNDSYAWDKWNREHIFTQTAFPNSDKDNHNIFACEGQINQIRGNLKFGEVSGTETIQVFGHDTGCKYVDKVKFEPCDDAKGEVARAVLYCTIYYGYSVTQIFDSISTCLKWHAQHPVTNREIYRNNQVARLQGNRNPFIDHPSYANKIYSGYTQYTNPDPIDGKTPAAGAKVTGIALDKTTAYLAVGGTLTLTVSFTPADAANQGYEVQSSSYVRISYVKNGNTITVTGKEEGPATIYAISNDGKFEASCQITVNKDGLAPANNEGGGSDSEDDDDWLLGCGGSIIASSVLISTTSLIGFILLALKKKKDE